ncbi:MAG: hypothetical protein PHT07_10135 [Paludibacter sp.]|nr:hypothetical protein [Paludibacter sp.]
MIEIPITNITTEIAQANVEALKPIFPQLPNDVDVWIIRDFWTPMGVTRMSASTERMLNKEIIKAIDDAMLNIPKGVLVLHEWPLRGILNEEVDLAIALHNIQLEELAVKLNEQIIAPAVATHDEVVNLINEKYAFNDVANAGSGGKQK